MELAIVVTTLSEPDAARSLARRIVEERLAACAQILAIESVYLWEGVQVEREFRLELKTTAAGVGPLMKRLAALHPYDEPELIALRVGSASEGYAAWVERSTVRP